MNIIKNITIELSGEDVKEIVTNYVRDIMRNSNVTTVDVLFNITKEEVGPQWNSYDKYYLKGVTVKCKMEE